MEISTAGRASAEGALAMTILGASTGVSVHLTHYPVLGGQAVRYLLATAVLFVLVRRQHRFDAPVRPTLRQWLLLGLLSLVGLVLFNVLVLATLRHADPATLGSTLACTPLLLALTGPLIGRTGGGANRRLLPAATIVVAGSVLVQGLGSHDLAGTLYSLGVLICEALFSLLAVPLLPRLGPLRVSAYTTALAVPILGIAGVIESGTAVLRMPTVGETAALLYLALPLTVGAFVLWYRCLSRLGAQRAGLLIGLVPLAACAAGVVLGAGLPSLPRLAGVALVTLGIAAGMPGSEHAGVAPDPGADDGHRGGDQGQADDEGVEEDADGEAEADGFDGRVVGEHEGQEDGEHDQCCGGHHAGGLAGAADDGGAGVVVSVVVLVDL